ncbi:Metallo-dependent phosphatase [Coprinellus micaceus]|uniref:Metallo-dependent phosphatase n=1 Tax=Coprinellus micaceus TaxID=71717 RepID=A0A4Y7TP69_COPMI|nr:Metallo-dependent phosphatase [Coprinellus micaceus]
MEVRVHKDHTSANDVPHPGQGWTRFVCISDTHSHFPEIPLGDVLFHAGDMSSWGYPAQIQQVFDWLVELPHPIKIVIGGNHDLCLDPDLHGVFEEGDEAQLLVIRAFVRSEAVKERGIHYLEYEGMEFTTQAGETWKVYGSPAAPRHARGAFQYDDEETAKELYRKVPPDTEILLTHTPPFGVLDTSKKGKNAGCRYLAERLRELHSCRLHVFGHMHEAFGTEVLGTDSGQRVAVNAAVASRKSKPVVVDIRRYSS